jgi:hypothetical protein
MRPKEKNALVEVGTKFTTGGWKTAQPAVEWAKSHKNTVFFWRCKEKRLTEERE